MFALVRAISDSISRCELTHVDREPIDLDLAREQHAAYLATLQALGCTLVALDGDEEQPDGVFVEDTAIVLPEIAVITRPGAPSRRGELESVADALGEHREIASIEDPGTLDGGDILQVGTRLYVGASGRSNEQGAAQLAEILEPHGYSVLRVPLDGCLHLKSACTCIGEELLLANAAWVDPDLLDIDNVIPVHESEPFAANVLAIGDAVLAGAHFPRTIEMLQRHGLVVLPVANSELAKAEGGLTCCSIIWT